MGKGGELRNRKKGMEGKGRVSKLGQECNLRSNGVTRGFSP